MLSASRIGSPPDIKFKVVVSDPSESWHSLLHWDEVPHWQRDNICIHGFYRKESGSYQRSIASLLYIHNETVNIYTHLIPTLITPPGAFALYQILQPRYARATQADVVVFGCFFVGVTLCLGISAIYHTISNHSPRVNKLGNQLDYVGIVLLITGSFVPSIYYGFWCDPNLQMRYWAMVSSLSLSRKRATDVREICSLGAGCTAVSVMSKFRTPAWRPFRAAMFVLMGLSAIFPVLDGVLRYGALQMRQQIGLSWLVFQGLLYVLGAGIYAVSR